MYAVGQYSKPKKALEERLCTLYHLNAIESEVHFLIDCPLYDDSQFLCISRYTSMVQIQLEPEGTNLSMEVIGACSSACMFVGVYKYDLCTVILIFMTM